MEYNGVGECVPTPSETYMEKTCLWCNRVYKTYKKKQKYCDTECQRKAHSQVMKNSHPSPATEFKKGHRWSVSIQKKTIKGQRLAAEKRGNLDNRPTIICLVCHKPFSDFKSNNRRFCSRICYEKFPKTKETREKMGSGHRGLKGPDSLSWKGGSLLAICEICSGKLYTTQWKRNHGQGRFCSNACRGVWVSRTTKGRKLTPDQVRNALRRRTPSGLELKFLHIVKEHSLPYRYVGNGAFFIEQFNPDFINTNHEKVAVEVYAKFHKELDGRTEESWKRKRSRVFKKYGWKVIYFEAKEVSEERVLSKLK